MTKKVKVEQGPIYYDNTETFEVTWYTAGYESTGKRPGHPLYGITASGQRVREQYSLACPPQMEFGTKVWIESVGVRTCVDRGGAIKGKRLDVYEPNLRTALRNGRQQLRVEIMD